jgi:hypothetical protein
MDQTSPRLYPYPQCEPPITEDASDIVQVANLALTIDADVQTQFNAIDNNLLSPDGCHIAAGAQTIQQGDPATFTILRFDNSPGSVMNETGGIRTRIDGTYLFTSWLQVDQGPTPPLDNLKVEFSVAGIGTLSSEGLSTNFNITTLPGEVNGSVILRLIAGRLVQVSVRTTGTVTLDIEQVEFSGVRIGPL